jgi:exosortase
VESRLLRPLRVPEGRGAWLGPVLVGVLALLAYRMLWLGARSTHLDLEGWLLRPGAMPGFVVLGVAGWLLWRRRQRLRALPERRAPLLALALATLGTGFFVWAPLSHRPDLLLPSLAANGLAFAAAARGRAGFRAVLLPALVLLFGVRLPRPLQNEVVWQLQLWTTEWAGRLLSVAGREFAQGGVILRNADHTFQVIEACSGMNGILILTLVALVVRELFAESGPRQWLLVALAPPLGFVLNVVRVTYVAASPDPEALAGVEGDHTTQGLAALMAGTAILYALGRGMAARTPTRRPAPSDPPPAAGVPWAAAALALAVLAVLAWTLPGLAAKPARRPLSRVDFPLAAAGWTGKGARIDPIFTGGITSGVYRRYQLGEGLDPSERVELLIAYEVPNDPSSIRLLSSKLVSPGPGWDLVRLRRARLWQLDRDVDLAVLARGEERAVVYAWRPRDRGLWRESWRDLLALDASPLRREGKRAAVRLVAYAPNNGQLFLDHAKQRLDRFVVAFSEALAAL